MLKDKTLVILILTGILLRIIFIPLPGFKFDMDAWFAWAIRLNQVGFANFYSDQIWTNYTPGFLYILAILGFIKNLLHISNNLFYLVLKLPSITAEIVLGMLFYRFTCKKSFYWAAVIAGLILFNPSFIFNSAVWGQIDGLLSLLIFLSIYFSNQKKLILSSIFFGLSFLIKPQAIAILPLFGLYMVKNFSIRNYAKIILPPIFIIFALSVPFFTDQPFGLVKLFSKMMSDYPFTSLFTYNFWGIVGFWINDSQRWNGLSYQIIGYILLTVYWITISYFYSKRKLSLYALASLALLGFYFLPTRVHERYLYPGIIFLIVLIGIYRSKVLLVLTTVLSLIHFLNLYYVYVYYNELYLKLPKVLYNPFLYNFLNNNGKILSLISTIIFITISFVIIKISYVSKKADS